MNNELNNKGFTLIELMIVVAIIAVISSVAYPSYTEYVARGRRGDAKASLLRMQLAQEKYRANNTTYATLAQLVALGTASGTSGDGYYTLSIAGISATGYTLTATRASTGAQASDKCGNFSIDEAGVKTVASAYTGYTADNCWDK